MLRDVQQAFYGSVCECRQAGAGGHDGSRPRGAVRRQERARRRPQGRARRHDAIQCRAGRPAHRRRQAAGTQPGSTASWSCPAFAWAADTDPLDMATMASIAAGVSTRRYAGTLDKLPEPDEPLSVSKSSVSRRWVALSQEQLHEWLSRLDQGAGPAGGDDRRHPLPRPRHPGGAGHRRQGQQARPGAARGLHREPRRVVRSLLSDLVERGLDADRARLWVIDGGKALRKAIVECFGALALHPALPGAQAAQRDRAPAARNCTPASGRAMRDAWNGANAELAKKQLQRLAASLQRQAPRRRGQPARGAGGDADGAGAGHHRGAVPHAAHHQPDREPQRLDRALHAQRQAMEGRADDAALDRRRAQRCQGALPQAARAPRHEDSCWLHWKPSPPALSDAERKAA
ncbi:MAG: hypothetical protein MZW92_20310 [Comamonadaceae bacterium]|nr:hypothetical protein [Comamonadaceae bacterium]